MSGSMHAAAADHPGHGRRLRRGADHGPGRGCQNQRGLSGISCALGHDRSKGAQRCRVTESLVYPTLSSTSCRSPLPGSPRSFERTLGPPPGETANGPAGRWRRRWGWRSARCRRSGMLMASPRTGCGSSSSVATRNLPPKLRDMVGLYIDPPDDSPVLSVGDKSQIQALARTQTCLPMKRGARRDDDPRFHPQRHNELVSCAQCARRRCSTIAIRSSCAS
jgi:hypothetical protein